MLKNSTFEIMNFRNFEKKGKTRKEMKRKKENTGKKGKQ